MHVYFHKQYINMLIYLQKTIGSSTWTEIIKRVMILVPFLNMSVMGYVLYRKSAL